MESNTHSTKSNSVEWQRARTILARSFYKQLKSSGYSSNQIIELSSEILGLVSGEIRSPNVAQGAK